MARDVYTDGACAGNPGPGGWAWVLDGGPFASGFAPETTNQRMEITAAFEALRSLDGPLEVVSDSTYVVRCFNDGWWARWIERGWRTSQRTEVANRDLWEPLIELVNERGDVSFRWVKGHSGNPLNDLADRLAVEAITNRTGRSGAVLPNDVGPPDASPIASGGGAQRGDSRVPSGHLLGVFGHRPPDLGGYEPNVLQDEVRNKLTEILAAKHQMYEDLVVLTGLRLGAEQIGAEAAAQAGVPFIAVLPYPDPEVVWPERSQARFRDLIGAAERVVQLERKVPGSKKEAGEALARRDGWLAANLDEAIVVWDRQGAAIGKLVAKLEKALGDEVWIVDPSEV